MPQLSISVTLIGLACAFALAGCWETEKQPAGTTPENWNLENLSDLTGYKFRNGGDNIITVATDFIISPRGKAKRVTLTIPERGLSKMVYRDASDTGPFDPEFNVPFRWRPGDPWVVNVVAGDTLRLWVSEHSDGSAAAMAGTESDPGKQQDVAHYNGHGIVVNFDVKR